MKCTACGSSVQDGVETCPNCGSGFIDYETASMQSQPDTDSQKGRYMKLSQKHYVMIFVAIVIIVVIGLFIGKSNSIEGRYVSVKGSRTYVLKQNDEHSGTFEVYTADGETIEDNKRKTWSSQDDLLTMFLGDDEYYFAIVDGGLIGLEDDDDEPAYSDYIAPEGSWFDYEIGNYSFNADGTYSLSGSSGKYYVEDDIIYCKRDSVQYSITHGGKTVTTPRQDFDYEPVFWIYNKDHITNAYNVFFKD